MEIKFFLPVELEASNARRKFIGNSGKLALISCIPVAIPSSSGPLRHGRDSSDSSDK